MQKSNFRYNQELPKELRDKPKARKKVGGETPEPFVTSSAGVPYKITGNADVALRVPPDKLREIADKIEDSGRGEVYIDALKKFSPELYNAAVESIRKNKIAGVLDPAGNVKNASMFSTAVRAVAQQRRHVSEVETKGLSSIWSGDGLDFTALKSNTNKIVGGLRRDEATDEMVRIRGELDAGRGGYTLPQYQALRRAADEISKTRFFSGDSAELKTAAETAGQVSGLGRSQALEDARTGKTILPLALRGFSQAVSLPITAIAQGPKAAWEDLANTWGNGPGKYEAGTEAFKDFGGTLTEAGMSALMTTRLAGIGKGLLRGVATGVKTEAGLGGKIAAGAKDFLGAELQTYGYVDAVNAMASASARPLMDEKYRFNAPEMLKDALTGFLFVPGVSTSPSSIAAELGYYDKGMSWSDAAFAATGMTAQRAIGWTRDRMTLHDLQVRARNGEKGWTGNYLKTRKYGPLMGETDGWRLRVPVNDPIGAKAKLEEAGYVVGENPDRPGILEVLVGADAAKNHAVDEIHHILGEEIDFSTPQNFGQDMSNSNRTTPIRAFFHTSFDEEFSNFAPDGFPLLREDADMILGDDGEPTLIEGAAPVDRGRRLSPEAREQWGYDPNDADVRLRAHQKLIEKYGGFYSADAGNMTDAAGAPVSLVVKSKLLGKNPVKMQDVDGTKNLNTKSAVFRNNGDEVIVNLLMPDDSPERRDQARANASQRIVDEFGLKPDEFHILSSDESNQLDVPLSLEHWRYGNTKTLGEALLHMAQSGVNSVLAKSGVKPKDGKVSELSQLAKNGVTKPTFVVYRFAGNGPDGFFDYSVALRIKNVTRVKGLEDIPDATRLGLKQEVIPDDVWDGSSPDLAYLNRRTEGKQGKSYKELAESKDGRLYLVEFDSALHVDTVARDTKGQTLKRATQTRLKQGENESGAEFNARVANFMRLVGAEAEMIGNAAAEFEKNFGKYGVGADDMDLIKYAGLRYAEAIYNLTAQSQTPTHERVNQAIAADPILKNMTDTLLAEGRNLGLGLVSGRYALQNTHGGYVFEDMSPTSIQPVGVSAGNETNIEASWNRLGELQQNLAEVSDIMRSVQSGVPVPRADLLQTPVQKFVTALIKGQARLHSGVVPFHTDVDSIGVYDPESKRIVNISIHDLATQVGVIGGWDATRLGPMKLAETRTPGLIGGWIRSKMNRGLFRSFRDIMGPTGDIVASIMQDAVHTKDTIHTVVLKVMRTAMRTDDIGGRPLTDVTTQDLVNANLGGSLKLGDFFNKTLKMNLSLIERLHSGDTAVTSQDSLVLDAYAKMLLDLQGAGAYVKHLLPEAYGGEGLGIPNIINNETLRAMKHLKDKFAGKGLDTVGRGGRMLEVPGSAAMKIIEGDPHIKAMHKFLSDAVHGPGGERLSVPDFIKAFDLNYDYLVTGTQPPSVEENGIWESALKNKLLPVEVVEKDMSVVLGKMVQKFAGEIAVRRHFGDFLSENGENRYIYDASQVDHETHRKLLNELEQRLAGYLMPLGQDGLANQMRLFNTLLGAGQKSYFSNPDGSIRVQPTASVDGDASISSAFEKMFRPVHSVGHPFVMSIFLGRPKSAVKQIGAFFMSIPFRPVELYPAMLKNAAIDSLSVLSTRLGNTLAGIDSSDKAARDMALRRLQRDHVIMGALALDMMHYQKGQSPKAMEAVADIALAPFKAVDIGTRFATALSGADEVDLRMGRIMRDAAAYGRDKYGIDISDMQNADVDITKRTAILREWLFSKLSNESADVRRMRHTYRFGDNDIINELANWNGQASTDFTLRAGRRMVAAANVELTPANKGPLFEASTTKVLAPFMGFTTGSATNMYDMLFREARKDRVDAKTLLEISKDQDPVSAMARLVSHSFGKTANWGSILATVPASLMMVKTAMQFAPFFAVQFSGDDAYEKLVGGLGAALTDGDFEQLAEGLKGVWEAEATTGFINAYVDMYERVTSLFTSALNPFEKTDPGEMTTGQQLQRIAGNVTGLAYVDASAKLWELVGATADRIASIHNDYQNGVLGMTAQEAAESGRLGGADLMYTIALRAVADKSFSDAIRKNPLFADWTNAIAMHLEGDWANDRLISMIKDGRAKEDVDTKPQIAMKYSITPKWEPKAAQLKIVERELMNRFDMKTIEELYDKIVWPYSGAREQAAKFGQMYKELHQQGLTLRTPEQGTIEVRPPYEAPK